MSIQIKREALHTMNLLVKATELLTKVPDMNSRLQCMMDMQEAIITVGNQMERIWGEDSEIMDMLSAAAEMIYQMSLCKSLKSLSVKGKEFEKDVYRMKEWMQRYMSDQAEILFLPYKSSMWDSLESVYRAALEDKDCKVYVMPIPYYYFSENKADMQQKYEGDFFRELPGFLEYDQVMISDMRPDVILIHNPYDDKNYVTSVDNNYFSRELIRYTDHLVYIPYKVCSGKVKEHYCLTDGVNNAWRVYVQSEAVREVYLKYHSTEKIRVIGSPKIDAVIQACQQKPEIPDEWREKITGKTVFLLNTELRSILNAGDRLLETIGEMIELLKIYDNIICIWRPHPLSEETMNAMRGELLPRYRELVDKFCENKNGIYDTLSTPYPAISYADAYIGDWSSMVTLFGTTGKPVYIKQHRSKRNVTKDIADMWTKEGQQLYLDNVKRKLKSAYVSTAICIESFIQMIVKGNDFLAEYRKEEFKKIVYDNSGTVGEKIWKDIRESL